VKRFGIVLLLAAALWADSGPRLEPLVGLPPHPEHNPGTIEKIKLGEMLFFERMLSGDQRRSCGSCHKPELLFMDGLSRAWGLNDMELRRKTPGLLNVGWQRTLFSDGRAETLEEQAAMPLKNHLEMDMDPDEAAERVREDPLYPQLFEKVFPGEPITFALIAKAIAAYERNLVSYDSDLDRYLLGDRAAMKPAAVRGMELFTGKAGCVSCHHGPLLTDHDFHYTGVPEISGGTPDGTKHKTATLRDAARRSSFMHNGHYLKLSQVIDHYAKGGAAPEGLTTEIKPIPLSDQEKSELVAFLVALNGRVTELVEDSPRDPGRWDVEPPKKAQGPAVSGPTQDPAYQKK
jgi:cytochrome c peroxidase